MILVTFSASLDLVSGIFVMLRNCLILDYFAVVIAEGMSGAAMYELVSLVDFFVH